MVAQGEIADLFRDADKHPGSFVVVVVVVVFCGGGFYLCSTETVSG